MRRKTMKACDYGNKKKLTAFQTARMLGFSTSTLSRKVRNGAVPFKPDTTKKAHMFDREEVRDYAEKISRIIRAEGEVIQTELPLSSPVEFEVGDKVSCNGVNGVVLVSNETHVGVEFECGNREDYLKDGRIKEFFKEPALVLVHRPQKVVDKTFYFWSYEQDGGFVKNGQLFTIKDVAFAAKPLGQDPQLHEIVRQVHL